MVKSKKSTKKNTFAKYLMITLLVMSLLVLGLIYFIGVFPLKYFLVVLVLLVLVDGIAIALMKKRGKRRVVGASFSFILIVLMILLTVYEVNTLSFLKKLGFVDYSVKNYSVLVLESSNYNNISDLKNTKIGLDESDDSKDDALSKLENQVSIKDSTSYDGMMNVISSLRDKDIDAILLEESQIKIFTESESEEENIDDLKNIGTIEVEIKETNIAKEVNVTNSPFNVYVSGIDTYGKINSISRSDVNVLLTINPNINEILITSIPRDYYVTLGTKGGKDKLTHAGVYGISESVKTIENLFDIDINYYVRVNFTSLINLVDTLGGITVNSSYDFYTSSYDDYSNGYHFTVGQNYLDGKKALSFVRERKSFIDGDVTRNYNQQLVIDALIDKMLSKSIITKYSSLLDSLADSFITNMPEDQLTDLIKYQIDGNYKWNSNKIILSCTNSSEYTFTYPSQQLSVMLPDYDSVNDAKDQIHQLLDAN